MAGPIEQFEIKSLFHIAEVGGHDISFTNSAVFMVQQRAAPEPLS